MDGLGPITHDQKCFDILDRMCGARNIDWSLRWKAHLPQLLKEMQTCSVTPLYAPVYNILRGVLTELAEVGMRTEDVEVQAAICRLALFEQSDPYALDYDPLLTHITFMRAALKKWERENIMQREELEEKYGEVWDTQQMQDKFTVIGFLAPYAEVTENESGKKGTIEFQADPRFYFNFIEDN